MCDYRHSSLYCALLYCALHTLCILQIEDLWQHWNKQVDWHHFSNNMCSLPVFVFHFGNPCDISNIFIVIITLMVSCDQWSVTIVIVLLWLFFMNQAHLRWQTWWINGVCILTAPMTSLSLSLFFSRDFPFHWNKVILKLGKLITLQWILSVSVKVRVTCLFKSKVRND